MNEITNTFWRYFWDTVRSLQTSLGLPLLIILVLMPFIIVCILLLIFVVALNENSLPVGNSQPTNLIAQTEQTGLDLEEVNRATISNLAKPSAIQVTAEIANTPAERSRGLMFRQELAADKGMLFIFPRAQSVEFWMKDTQLSLDIIFISADKRIINIAKQAKPLVTDKTYPSNGQVLYVLEVNAGFTDQNNYSIGDQLDIKFKQEKIS